MKRYMKLIRKILEYVETAKTTDDNVPLPEFDDYRQCQVEYHVKLCEEAGYLVIVAGQKRRPAAISRITWHGHEELDRLRKEGCDA